MTVNQDIILLFAFLFNPGDSIIEVLNDGVLKDILDRQHLVAVYYRVDRNSFIKKNLLSHMHVRMALMLCFFKRSYLRVLTTSPRNNPPIASDGLKMQLIFSSFLLLTATRFSSKLGGTIWLPMYVGCCGIRV